MTNRFSRSLASLGLALLLSGAVLGEPSQSGLDLSNLDRSTPASQDFFQYSNGGWLKANPIPADKPRWGTFNQLYENNQSLLQAILIQAAAHAEDENSRKIGDFYSSGMEAPSQAAGLELLKAETQSLAQASTPAQLQSWVTGLHQRGLHPYFSFGSAQDAKDSSQVIGQLNQGGLGLPDCEYYTRSDEKSVKIRAQYLEFIAAVFQRWGEKPEVAAKKAQQAFDLESQLAKSSMTLVEQRDPEASYHPVTPSELAQQAPQWDWDSYFKTLGAPAMGRVNLSSPKFFTGLAQVLKDTPLEAQQSYLQWQLLRNSADYLSEDWSVLSFGFYGKTLTGALEISPRWRRVVKVIDSNMGDALGEKYVAQHFPPAAKAKVDDMVVRLRKSLSKTLDGLEWMSAATKEQAQAKLASFRAKIGYPERWRDYSALKIDRKNYLANVWNSEAFEVKRDLAKIGKPQDRNEWYMSPPTVNAYYDPQNNEIVFPAGILQPPFFSLSADDAVNYGALGVVIGHEITHGFDDQGAQFDAKGNLRNWWGQQDLDKFKGLAKAIEDQFSGYQVADGLHINGKLVVGESIADLGGLKLAMQAYADSQVGKPAQVLDGFTPDQRFFLAYARIWAMNLRPEYERLQVNTDPHPHPRFRVNGPLSNLEEFQKSFAIPAESPMVRKQRNRVW
ncbi:M13 family metallopeptidase [bacterium]|nr:M13 family metallopeptidase [bacterium]